MIRLMIVEDNDLVRGALVKFLAREKDITILADVANGAAAICALARTGQIDLILVDWNMPDMNGLEITRQVSEKYPDLKTVILTMHGKQEYKDQAKAAGACGYLLKGGDFEELINDLRAIARGEIIFR